MSNQSYTGVDNLEVMADASNYNGFLVREILRHAGDARTAVDFGAGLGVLACAMRDGGLHVVCVEPDRRLAAGLRRLGFACHASLDDLPEGGAAFIYCINVLEHIEDDAAAVRAICRSLEPGGRFYLYVPAFPLLYSTMDRKVGHCRRYRRSDLLRLLSRAGLIVQRATYADSLGFLATLLYRLLGNRQGDLNPTSLRFYDRAVFPISRLLDRLLGNVLGKNLAVSALRPATPTLPAVPQPAAPTSTGRPLRVGSDLKI